MKIKLVKGDAVDGSAGVNADATALNSVCPFRSFIFFLCFSHFARDRICAEPLFAILKVLRHTLQYAENESDFTSLHQSEKMSPLLSTLPVDNQLLLKHVLQGKI